MTRGAINVVMCVPVVTLSAVTLACAIVAINLMSSPISVKVECKLVVGVNSCYL